jgi:hypothetical protein
MGGNAGFMPLTTHHELLTRYPGESEGDVAILESARRNYEHAQYLLAEHGLLDKNKLMRLQLRNYDALFDLSVIALSIPLEVPSAASMPIIGRNLATTIASSEGSTMSSIGLANKTIEQVLSDPKLLGGSSPDEVMKMLDSAGIKYSIRPTTGSVQTGTVIDIEGGGSVNQIRFHPGGGRHTGSYWTLSGSSSVPGMSGKTQVVGPNYVPISGQKANVIQGYFDSDNE